MSVPSKLNKENFRLLDLSSDEESEDLQLEIIPSRKKKITRRERSRVLTHQTIEPNIGTEVRCALQWAVRGTLLLWLLMLTWICATLYDQVSTIKPHLDKVSISSNTVDDALQVCHTATKVLKANVSDLAARLDQLEKFQQDLAKQVDKATLDLTVVTDQLSAAPKLADTPRKLAELQRTVGTMGSQINGFDSSINSARKQALSAVGIVEELRTLLNQVDSRANETIANVTANFKKDDDIRTDIATVNSTLTAKVTELESRIQELAKPVSTLPPVTSTVPSSTTSVANVTSTTTAAVPPVKPAVLH